MKQIRAINSQIKAGWTIANQAYRALPGAEEVCAAHRYPREHVFIEAARDDDWIGVQAYTRIKIGPDGPIPAPPEAERTLTGWEYYARRGGRPVRHTASIVGLPMIVTENGIATNDDARRIAYYTGALAAVAAPIEDGLDVRGYLAWSALGNYEWGSCAPTFGLIAVDAKTFARTPNPSAHWLGEFGRTRRIPCLPH